MIKVKLKSDSRGFEEENTNFSISPGEEKVLTRHSIKDLNIRQALIKGTIRISEGEQFLRIRDNLIYLTAEKPNRLYTKTSSTGTLMVKDLDHGVYINEAIPENIKKIMVI